MPRTARPVPFASRGISLINEPYPAPLGLAERLAFGPARILGLPAGRLAAGAPAHLTLVDPTARWTLRAGTMRSAGTHWP